MTSPSNAMSKDLSDQLIERFNKAIDLPAYLTHRGYWFDEAVVAGGHTTSLLMVQADPAVRPSRLYVAKDPESGTWTYSNDPLNPRRTIVDYLVRHEDLSRAEALQRIVHCVDRRSDGVVWEASNYQFHVREKSQSQRQAEVEHHRFVQQQRQVLAELARIGIQSAQYRIAHEGCDVGEPSHRFPPVKCVAHVAGLAEEPQQLWRSAYARTDQRVVLVERPVDAISYSQRHKDPNACYLAVGSRLTAERQRELGALLSQMPKGMSVVAAFGRDQGGRQLLEQLRSVTPGLQMTRAEPQFGSTWSNQMQLEARHRRSMRPREAGLSR